MNKNLRALQEAQLYPLPDFPSILQIQSISYCNAACIYCPYPETKNELPQGKMEKSVFDRVIQNCIGHSELKFIALVLQNEPLLDNRIVEFAENIRRSLPEVLILLTTNGSLLDRDTCHQLLESRLNRIIISIGGLTERTFAYHTAGIRHADVFENILFLIEKNRENYFPLEVCLSIVETKENCHEIPPTRQFWRKLGVRTVVLPLSNRTGVLTNYRQLNVNRKDNAAPGICRMPFEKLNVLFNGDVLACCQDWKRRYVVGNVMQKPLHDIWRNDLMSVLRRKLIAGKQREISMCRECIPLEY